MNSWVQVGGVYWRNPPEEGLMFLSVKVVLAVAAAAALALSIAKKRRHPDWYLKKHMAEIGCLVTLIYLAGIAALIWGRIDTLYNMPLNEVGDFFAGAFGPIAFLWLVLGYFQQGDGLRLSTKALELQAEELRQGTEALLLQAEELKKSVEQQSIMASAATLQIQAQKEAYEAKQREVENLYKARFYFSSPVRYGGYAVGTLTETELEVICQGSDAFDVIARFEPPIGDMSEIHIDKISKARACGIKLGYVRASKDVFGTITLGYTGADGKERREKYAYQIESADPWVKVKNKILD